MGMKAGMEEGGQTEGIQEALRSHVDLDLRGCDLESSTVTLLQTG